MCSNDFSIEAEGLQIERDRLQNAVFHLQRTNRELEEFLQTEGHDKDLRDAIGENIVIIAKYKGQIERLEQELRKAKGEIIDVSLSQTVPIHPSTLFAPTPAVDAETANENDTPSMWM